MAGQPPPVNPPAPPTAVPEPVRPTAEALLPKWQHQPGDIYRVLITSAWYTNGRTGFSHHLASTEHPTLAKAIHEGFTEHDRSDDFNVAVFRGGHLVASLWMDEVVSDDPTDLAWILDGHEEVTS